MNIHADQTVLNPKRQSNGERSGCRLRQACRDFESVFIAYLLKSMRQTVPKVSITKQSRLDNDIYMSMMDAELAQAVARRSGIGLAEILYNQLSRSKNI